MSAPRREPPFSWLDLVLALAFMASVGLLVTACQLLNAPVVS